MKIKVGRLTLEVLEGGDIHIWGDEILEANLAIEVAQWINNLVKAKPHFKTAEAVDTIRN